MKRLMRRTKKRGKLLLNDAYFYGGCLSGLKIDDEKFPKGVDYFKPVYTRLTGFLIDFIRPNWLVV